MSDIHVSIQDEPEESSNDYDWVAYMVVVAFHWVLGLGMLYAVFTLRGLDPDDFRAIVLGFLQVMLLPSVLIGIWKMIQGTMLDWFWKMYVVVVGLLLLYGAWELSELLYL